MTEGVRGGGDPGDRKTGAPGGGRDPAADPPAESGGEVVRVVLLGFMGAGKSTVGARLARRLGWRFVDLDQWIEQRAGRTIPEIFARQGEAHFRRLEAQLTEEVAAEEDLVLAPGGGWITTAGNLERFGTGTLSVWLQVSAEAAVERAVAAGATRPLLAVPDPAATAARLLREREALYARANLHLSTLARGPDDLVREIEAYIRMRKALPLRSQL